MAPPWAEHVQGAAVADGCWYVTQVDRIWRFPLDLDLSGADPDNPQVTNVGLPEPGIDHLGDGDIHDGRLYVAMEGTVPARIGALDLDLRYLGSADVAAQAGSCPWCAIDPGDGLLYSSPFDTDRLCAYRPNWTEAGGFSLRHVRDVELRTEDGTPLRLERVQGGSFAEAGCLCLTSDSRDGGIHGIDVRTGRRMLHHRIPFEPDGPQNEVIEGIVATDLGAPALPWLKGILHVLVLARRQDESDRVWFQHYDTRDHHPA